MLLIKDLELWIWYWRWNRSYNSGYYTTWTRWKTRCKFRILQDRWINLWFGTEYWLCAIK